MKQDISAGRTSGNNIVSSALSQIQADLESEYNKHLKYFEDKVQDLRADSLAAGGTLLMISKEAGGQSQTGCK